MEKLRNRKVIDLDSIEKYGFRVGDKVRVIDNPKRKGFVIGFRDNGTVIVTFGFNHIDLNKDMIELEKRDNELTIQVFQKKSLLKRITKLYPYLHSEEEKEVKKGENVPNTS